MDIAIQCKVFLYGISIKPELVQQVLLNYRHSSMYSYSTVASTDMHYHAGHCIAEYKTMYESNQIHAGTFTVVFCHSVIFLTH